MGFIQPPEQGRIFLHIIMLRLLSGEGNRNIEIADSKGRRAVRRR